LSVGLANSRYGGSEIVIRSLCLGDQVIELRGAEAAPPFSGRPRRNSTDR
jgi:hypothetical protein